MLVVAAVIARGDAVLICLRPAHKHHGGLWEFPGGKVHEGETTSAALTRELSEELAVAAVVIGEPLFHAQDPSGDIEIVFIPAEIDREPEALEHLALVWCNRSDLLSYSLAPTDRKFAEFLTTTRS